MLQYNQKFFLFFTAKRLHPEQAWFVWYEKPYKYNYPKGYKRIQIQTNICDRMDVGSRAWNWRNLIYGYAKGKVKIRLGRYEAEKIYIALYNLWFKELERSEKMPVQ